MNGGYALKKDSMGDYEYKSRSNSLMIFNVLIFISFSLLLFTLIINEFKIIPPFFSIFFFICFKTSYPCLELVVVNITTFLLNIAKNYFNIKYRKKYK